MTNRNIFSRITQKTMLQNRTRTVVTVIGVILSTAMITAVTTFGYSFWGALADMAREQAGDWHVAVQHVKIDEVSALTQEKGVEASGVVYDAGFAAWPGMTDGDGFYDYFCIESLSEEALEMLPFTLASGRLPRTADEILLPRRLYDTDSGAELQIPKDVLNLQVGDLYVDGERYLYGTIQSEEPVFELRDTAVRSYRVVGTYEWATYDLHVAGLAYDLFTGPDAERVGAAGAAAGSGSAGTEAAVESAGSGQNGIGASASATGYADVFLRLSNPQKTYEYAEDQLPDYEIEYNYELLRWLGVSRHNNFLPVIISLLAIAVSVIMVGAVSLIYNAFSISLRERTTQFGLLSSIGATKRQLRRCMLTEAFYVSIAGIPFGILSGILGIGVTLRFVSGGITGAMYGVSRQIHLKTSPAVLIVTALLALATVLISAWIPTRRIRHISPMEAIRASRDIRVPLRPGRKSAGRSRRSGRSNAADAAGRTGRVGITDMGRSGRAGTTDTGRTGRAGAAGAGHSNAAGFLGKLGVTGMLAERNYSRDRRKYRSTVFSLTISIVLFVTAMSLSDFLKNAGGFVMDVPETQIMYTPYPEPDETARSEIMQILAEPEEVEQVLAYRSAGRYLSVQNEVLNEQAMHYGGLKAEEDVTQIYCRVILLEDADFERFLQAQGLDPKDYAGGDVLRAAAFDMSRSYSVEEDRYKQDQTFTSLPVTCEMGVLDSVEKDGEWDTVFLDQMQVEIQDRVSAYPQGISNFYESSVCLFIPESEAEAFGVADPELDVFERRFSVRCKNTEKVYEELQKALKDKGYPTDASALQDMTQEYKMKIRFLFAVDILMFGFVTLISLVAAANVFNTISTNLLLRRREFAMLRSMGMDGRDMRRMLLLESLIYTGRSVLFGAALGVGVSFLIFRSGARGVDTGFSLPWQATGIAVLGVLIVVFGTMALTFRTIRRANISEELKMD